MFCPSLTFLKDCRRFKPINLTLNPIIPVGLESNFLDDESFSTNETVYQFFGDENYAVLPEDNLAQ